MLLLSAADMQPLSTQHRATLKLILKYPDIKLLVDGQSPSVTDIYKRSQVAQHIFVPF